MWGYSFDAGLFKHIQLERLKITVFIRSLLGKKQNKLIDCVGI